MKRIDFERIFDNIRRNQTMVHCITNYVTINDVANMILAIGASPIWQMTGWKLERSQQCVTVS